MPIYEYRCERCGVFEHTQRITEPALQKCPTCRKKVTRLISNTSFQLKGGGWYVTDYARKGAGDGAKESGTSSGSSSESKSETKSETKPETKSETKKSDTKTTAGAGT